MKKALMLATLMGMALSACAGPRIVSSMSTTRDSKFRLLFYRNLGFGASEQGVIDCDAQADGSLSGCKPVTLTFVEDK